MRLALASLLLLLSSACSSTSGKCGPASCTGCCDATGACVTASTNLSCGTSGAACVSCTLGMNCVLGQCSSGSSQGGGSGGTGGGTGGGSATGGGTGGGATGGSGGGTTGGGGGMSLIPNVMLLVDTSGSMSLPINPVDPACPANCGTSGNACPPSCPTRISTLRSIVGTWLATKGAALRLGLTTYPSGTLCEPPLAPAVDLPPATLDDVGTTQALQNNASQISVHLQSLTPQGGTPTGTALLLLSSLSSLTRTDGRADYVVLLTDGLPNCNTNNANRLCECAASCTTAQVSSCQCTTSTCTGSLCSMGCLDASATVAAVSTLAAAGIKTVVVGFGADTAMGSAPTVLDAMARVGGAARSCPNGTTAECGGGTCLGNQTCASAYYQAASGADLQAVLDRLF